MIILRKQKSVTDKILAAARAQVPPLVRATKPAQAIKPAQSCTNKHPNQRNQTNDGGFVLLGDGGHHHGGDHGGDNAGGCGDSGGGGGGGGCGGGGCGGG
ncbi:hypothetical protein M5689_010060 [Euphorbia peplus]|nr:hypothetical protein M5689_010060 [Euphorbia peplus]